MPFNQGTREAGGLPAFQGPDSIKPVLDPAKKDICGVRHTFANVFEVTVRTLGKHIGGLQSRGGRLLPRPEATVFFVVRSSAWSFKVLEGTVHFKGSAWALEQRRLGQLKGRIHILLPRGC